MREWFSLAELAAARLPDMPQTRQGLEALAERDGWRGREQLCRKIARRGGGYEYHVALLPASAQLRLKASQTAHDSAAAPEHERLWARFHALPDAVKKTCEQRLKAVQTVFESVSETGVALSAVVALTARQHQVSTRTLYNWLELVRGKDRSLWLALLAPESKASAARAECHAKAWDYIKSDYLRPEAPKFSACYRRMVKVAKREKWEPIASEPSLRRRLDAEVPRAVQVLAREGRDKAKALFPAQRRTRDHLHAMQAVNMDGHKLDVFVSVPWKKKPTRMFLLGIQDLYSGKIVSWRLSDSENKETVRLALGDMAENFGIPDEITLDNGRAFASKWISGGSPTRYRFKVREEEPEGLLTALGIRIHWTQVYSGQSKPIERAWRDLAENISKHPFCSGAYTGNKPDAKPENYATRAIPLEAFRLHVAAQIVEHNAQTGRRGGNCKGRSFDEVFAESMAAPGTIVRTATATQRALWLLASEAIKAQKDSGQIHFYGNRYWARELNQYAGKKVVIRFDPDHLHDPVRVYDLDSRLICVAECIANDGFYDADAGRIKAKQLADYLKATTAAKNAEVVLTARELGELYYGGVPEAPADPAPMPKPKVQRMITGNLALKPAPQHDYEQDFSRALSMIGASVIQFPSNGNEPKCDEYGSAKKERA